MTSTSEKELVMTTQTNVCACGTCVGTQCTCGCQNAAAVPATLCQCGEVGNCGPTCTCEGCQHANVRKSESRYHSMKAIVREIYGPPDVLHLADVPMPTVRDGDVLVRVQ